MYIHIYIFSNFDIFKYLDIFAIDMNWHDDMNMIWTNWYELKVNIKDGIKRDKMGRILPFGRLFYFGRFFGKKTEVEQKFGYFFPL
jgi:hypothetical protein